MRLDVGMLLISAGFSTSLQSSLCAMDIDLRLVAIVLVMFVSVIGVSVCEQT